MFYSANRQNTTHKYIKACLSVSHMSWLMSSPISITVVATCAGAAPVFYIYIYIMHAAFSFFIPLAFCVFLSRSAYKTNSLLLTTTPCVPSNTVFCYLTSYTRIMPYIALKKLFLLPFFRLPSYSRKRAVRSLTHFHRYSHTFCSSEGSILKPVTVLRTCVDMYYLFKKLKIFCLNLILL
jgi:hypothetical protein